MTNYKPKLRPQSDKLRKVVASMKQAPSVIEITNQPWKPLAASWFNREGNKPAGTLFSVRQVNGRYFLFRLL